MEKIRVVIDTNILVSAHIAPGRVIHKIVDEWVECKFTLVLPKSVLEEAIEVLKRKDINLEKIEKLLNLISQKAVLVEPKTKIVVVRGDPEDNKFLECAVEGNAKYIISGDKHLLALKQYKNIQIIQARKFIDVLSKIHTL